MATTPNYGWVTPAPTDLVTDLPADFEIFADAVDGDLAGLLGGTTGQVLKKTSNLDHAFAFGVDPTFDLVTTAGDLVYGTAADTMARLGIGTANQVLTVNAGATAPEWKTPAGGGGKVLQVIQATTTTQVQVSTTTYTDTSLTANITPSLATSRILVLVSQPFLAESTSTGVKFINVKQRLLRGATDIFSPTGGAGPGFELDTNATYSGYQNIGIITYSYVDSPSTTSSTTYKTQGAPVNSTNRTVYFQNTQQSMISSIILMEIGA